MAKLPLPDRGQPLDVTYMYAVASAVNDIATEISSATYNYTDVKTREAGDQTITTAQARIVCGYVDVVTNENVIAGTTKTFSYGYNSDFKYAPIVTATPVNTGSTPIGNEVQITLTAITTGRVDGILKFNQTGIASVSINIMAIGIPTYSTPLTPTTPINSST